MFRISCETALTVTSLHVQKIFIRCHYLHWYHNFFFQNILVRQTPIHGAKEGNPANISVALHLYSISRSLAVMVSEPFLPPKIVGQKNPNLWRERVKSSQHQRGVASSQHIPLNRKLPSMTRDQSSSPLDRPSLAQLSSRQEFHQRFFYYASYKQ